MRAFARAQSASSAASRAASTSARPRSRSSASASRCCRMRCANSAALGLGDELLRAGIENRESCFFNRFGQLIYKEPRGKFAGYQYPEVGIHRGRLHLILYEAARERLGADAIVHRPRLHRRRAGRAAARPCTSSRPARQRCRRSRRRRDRLRRHQFGAAQAVLSGRQGGLRRHQHLARRDAAQADPRRPHLYARRLDPDRQDRDLSDHRQRRRRRQPAHQLDDRDQARHASSRTTGTSRAISRTSSRSTRAGASTGSTWRR